MPAFLAPVAWNLGRIGVQYAVRSFAQRTATAAAQNAVPVAATITGAAAVSSMMNGASDEVNRTLAKTEATEACAVCGRNNPCQHLQNGLPGSKYRGGSHLGMSQPSGDGKESHHTPAKAVSPLPTSVGPAIQMDPLDHAKTASSGKRPGFQAYQAKQARLIAAGNFMGAIALDVADIKLKFEDKYDAAIGQMMAYATCLKKHGIVR
ncbi:MAG: hypothetical protein RID11_09015 [Roseovarius sp.]|uniref:hypothetical protein n=1 Tax=Roseovarius sp. TaxID=1486281 RepID=UPI0032EF8695